MNDIMVFDDRPLLSMLILAGHHQKGLSSHLSKAATPVTFPVCDHITKNLVLSRSLQGWMARALEFGGLRKVRGKMREGSKYVVQVHHDYVSSNIGGAIKNVLQARIVNEKRGCNYEVCAMFGNAIVPSIKAQLGCCCWELSTSSTNPLR